MPAPTHPRAKDRRRPVLIYDADCGFCRRWIDRWRRQTGGKVTYLPYQPWAVRWRYRIRKADARRATQLIDSDGRRYAGAAAVFRILLRARSGWVRALARIGLSPGARLAAEAVYRLVARHRQAASRIERRWLALIGARPQTSVARGWSRSLSRPNLPLRALGLVYLVAFRSLRAQVLGLYGERGILPIRRQLERQRERLERKERVRTNDAKEGVRTWLRRFRAVPTLLWLDPSDAGLRRLCEIGEAAGVALCAGVAPRLSAAVAWAAYLSFVSTGREFLRYQWDVLLLEAGLQALLGRHRRLLARTLAFRLQLESGLAKLASHDPTWRNLSACCYHQETQPLPTPVGWYAHHLPRRVKQLGTALTLAVELGAPFLAWVPGRARRAAFGVLTGFQALIALTGNFAFFNWLTAVLNLSFLEERDEERDPRAARTLSRRPLRALGLAAESAAAAALLALGAYDLYRRLRSSPNARVSATLDRLAAALAPLRAVGSYGLFAVMTTKRPEIVIEGSEDGETWREYDFRYKPGDVRRPPRWAAPHQPRLDWQMWFAALQYPPLWFPAFLNRLLEGSPDVLALFERNPFPGRPPRFVRALLYEYQMTDLRTRRRTGRCWKRERIGVYFPAVSSPASG